jgi:hypothetical protein
MIDGSKAVQSGKAAVIGRRGLSLLLYVYSLYGTLACGAAAVMQWNQEWYRSVLPLTTLGVAIGLGWLGFRLAEGKWAKVELPVVLGAATVGIIVFCFWYSGLPADWADREQGFATARKILPFVENQYASFIKSLFPIGVVATVISWKILRGSRQTAQTGAATQQQWKIHRRFASILLYLIGSVFLAVIGVFFDKSFDYLIWFSAFSGLPMMLILAGMWISPSANRRAEGIWVATLTLVLALVIYSLFWSLVDGLAPH